MIAVDTNILLYVYDDRAPEKRERALSLLTSLDDGVLLWQVAIEFLAASRKFDRSPDGALVGTPWRVPKDPSPHRSK